MPNRMKVNEVMTEVLALLRRAIAADDADAMRGALDQLLGGEGGGLSAAHEYASRHEHYVMHMPQSGERISGRDRMRAMQESFPGPPPAIRLERVSGSGRTWVVEGVNDYGDGDTWHVVLILEFADDGRMLRDTRYYATSFGAPAWRAPYVDTAGDR
jgi:acetyl-CoA acetyltransferase